MEGQSLLQKIIKGTLDSLIEHEEFEEEHVSRLRECATTGDLKKWETVRDILAWEKVETDETP